MAKSKNKDKEYPETPNSKGKKQNEEQENEWGN